MPQKIFKRIGIRRDKNFADLTDPKGALNNLLDTIVDVTNPDGTPGTFISEDLNAIRNLFAEGMSNSNYLQFAGSRVTFSDQNGNSQTLQPRSTYQNRLDIFEAFSGTPRLRGGDGLTAKYYNFNQIDDKKSTSIHALPVDDIFSGDSGIADDQLWDNGEFEYTGKIHPASVNANGGVKWEGFFVPTITAKHSFSVSATASFSFDFEDPSYTGVGVNTYREYARVSAACTTTCVRTIVGTGLTLTAADQGRFIGVGMNVSSDIPNLIRPGTKVEAVNPESGVITLENPNGDPVNFQSSGTVNITFDREIGQPASRSMTTAQVLERGRPYRIRARFYIPPFADSQRIDRNIFFDFTPFGGSFGDLIFTQLYNLNYDFSESAKGGFIDFLDNSVGFGGGTLGGTTISTDYVEVRSTKKIDIKYEPKTSFNAINVKTFSNATFSSGSTILVPNSNTTNLEVGNFVFGAGIQSGTRIAEIKVNEFIVLDKAVTSTSSGSSVVIIEHRGFAKRVPNCNNNGAGVLTSGSNIAGEFITATNATTSHGDVTISRTGGQSGILSLVNVTDNTTLNYTFSDSFTTIPTSAFTAGKQYRISTNPTMDLRFVMHGAGGGSGGGAGGKLDATITINSGTNYTLIVGEVGRDPGGVATADYTGFSESRRLRMGGGGSGFNGGYSGGGFTGLFETTTMTATALFNAAILVAGGGGGKGVNNTGGGAGGGTSGGNGSGPDAGQGGTQTTGGQGGRQGNNEGGFPGTQLLGGHGANQIAGGGGGGGGYYGGGAGRGDSNSNPGGLPGGGGSGFINQSKGANEIAKFTNIDNDMLVITSGSDVPAYTRVTSVINENSITISNSTAFTGRDAYFYQSRGLINKSLDTFCVPAAGNTILCKLIDSDASSGTSQITLANITGVQETQTVTGFGVQTGTTITGISGSTITLSLPLNANIKAGATVTVATAAEGDKSLCCPPTDTSPPFEPTDEGLKTTTANPVLSIAQGNLIFDTITATVNPNDYNFPLLNGNGTTTNNFSEYVIGSGERAGNFMMIHTGVDFSNPNSGTAYRILMNEVSI